MCVTFSNVSNNPNAGNSTAGSDSGESNRPSSDSRAGEEINTVSSSCCEKAFNGVKVTQTPWIGTAVSEMVKFRGANGTGELEGVIGRTTNYHSKFGLSNSMTAYAWCASFMNYSFKETGHSYFQTYTGGDQSTERAEVMRALATRRHSRYFTEIGSGKSKTEIVFGTAALMCTNRSNGQFHNTFLVASLGGQKYAWLGGNQGDKLRISNFAPFPTKDTRREGFYLPASYIGPQITKNDDTTETVTEVYDIVLKHLQEDYYTAPSGELTDEALINLLRNDTVVQFQDLYIRLVIPCYKQKIEEFRKNNVNPKYKDCIPLPPLIPEFKNGKEFHDYCTNNCVDLQLVLADGLKTDTADSDR